MEKYYSTKEISELTGVTRSAINYYYSRYGYGRMIGGRLIFNERDLEEIKRQMENSTQGKR